MAVRHIVLGSVFLTALFAGALTVQGQSAPPPTSSPNFGRAILAEMDTPSRADAERRAAAGNSVSSVVATILLNDQQMSRLGTAGIVAFVAIDVV